MMRVLGEEELLEPLHRATLRIALELAGRDEIRELAKVAQLPGVNCLGMC